MSCLLECRDGDIENALSLGEDYLVVCCCELHHYDWGAYGLQLALTHSDSFSVSRSRVLWFQ